MRNKNSTHPIPNPGIMMLTGSALIVGMLMVLSCQTAIATVYVEPLLESYIFEEDLGEEDFADKAGIRRIGHAPRVLATPPRRVAPAPVRITRSPVSSTTTHKVRREERPPPPTVGRGDSNKPGVYVNTDSRVNMQELSSLLRDRDRWVRGNRYNGPDISGMTLNLRDRGGHTTHTNKPPTVKPPTGTHTTRTHSPTSLTVNPAALQNIYNHRFETIGRTDRPSGPVTPTRTGISGTGSFTPSSPGSGPGSRPTHAVPPTPPYREDAGGAVTGIKPATIPQQNMQSILDRAGIDNYVIDGDGNAVVFHNGQITEITWDDLKKRQAEHERSLTNIVKPGTAEPPPTTRDVIKEQKDPVKDDSKAQKDFSDKQKDALVSLGALPPDKTQSAGQSTPTTPPQKPPDSAQALADAIIAPLQPPPKNPEQMPEWMVDQFVGYIISMATRDESILKIFDDPYIRNMEAALKNNPEADRKYREIMGDEKQKQKIFDAVRERIKNGHPDVWKKMTGGN